MYSSICFDIDFRDELTGIEVFMWNDDVQDWAFAEGRPLVPLTQAEVEYIEAAILEMLSDF